MGIDPVSAGEEHVAMWALRMQAAGLAPATRARRLSTVSSWYDWLTRHGLAGGNPVEHLDRPYVDPDVSKTPGLTKDQAIAMLGYADRATSRAALRNAALVYLFIFTGARVSEITGADEGHLGTDRGHRVLWITGKGGGQYPLVIPPVAGERLDAYLASRTDRPRPLPALPGQV
jgi:integrase/recombinase XerD